MGKNKAHGDICSITLVQIPHGKFQRNWHPWYAFPMESSFVWISDYTYMYACAYTHTKIITGKLGNLLQAIAEILEIQMKPLFHPQPLQTLAGTHHL